MLITAPLTFGDWLPDAPNLLNQLVQAENVYPVTGGYGPFEGPRGTGDTTTEAVNGARLFIRDDGTPLVAAGSATKLIVRDIGGVTETGGYTETEAWQFERFDNFVVAVSAGNAPQYLSDIATDAVWSNLPGTPPQAAVCGRVLDFLVLGDLVDIDASVKPNRLRWGVQNNPAGAWVNDIGNLSGSLDLPPEYGAIRAIVRGPSGIVFQERAIWRMDFVGAPAVFDCVPISTDMGCVAPGSVVNIGGWTYCLSQGGFIRTDGSGVEMISGQRVSEWFEGENTSALKSKVHGAVNWPKRAVVWAFVPVQGSGFARQLIWSMDQQRWTSARATIDYLVGAKIDAVTIGDLGTLYPDGLTFGALGNPEFLSRDLALGAFVPAGGGSEFATMNGPALEAVLLTGDQQPVPGRRTRLNGLMPLVENTTGNTRCAAYARERQSGAALAGAATPEGADGFCPQNIDGRFIAAAMVIPAGAIWSKAQGLLARFRASGAR